MRVQLTVGFLALAGCGLSEAELDGVMDEAPAEDDGVTTSELSTATFDMNNLMTDAELTGAQWVTASQVQGFLVSKGSFLARYKDPAWNETAAQLIVERSKAHGISPIYMLARIETESSLVRSGTSNYLSQATGCGCPDGSGCSASWSGFGKQVDCSAIMLRHYLDDLAAGKTTIAGWKPGLTKGTADPCSVTPQNRATAALYTYTPWVGAYALQCGRKTVGGSSLVALLHSKFKAEYSWGTGAPPASQCWSGTLAANIASGTCVQNSRDALWRKCVDGAFTAAQATEPSGCVKSYPYCHSSTLNQNVPARTCVQARSDSQWYQCGASGAWLAASAVPSSGAGPVGECSSVHAL